MRKLVEIGLLATIALGMAQGQFREAVSESAAVPSQMFQSEQEAGQKSVLVAIGLSLILPGMGELYAGNFSYGRYHLIADGVLWLGFGGLVLRADWIRDDARTFAAQHAGADFTGKGENFEVDVGNFGSVDEYNETRLRNREYDRVYTGTRYAWYWDTDENRARFKRLRIRSDEMYQGSKFVLGALIVNRLVSAFAAARSASRSGKTPLDGWRLEPTADGELFGTNGIGITLTKEF